MSTEGMYRTTLKVCQKVSTVLKVWWRHFSGTGTKWLRQVKRSESSPSNRLWHIPGAVQYLLRQTKLQSRRSPFMCSPCTTVKCHITGGVVTPQSNLWGARKFQARCLLFQLWNNFKLTLVLLWTQEWNKYIQRIPRPTEEVGVHGRCSVARGKRFYSTIVYCRTSP